MREGIWDSNNTLSSTSRNEKDLPFIDFRDEATLLEWLNNDLNDKYDSKKDRLEYISRIEKMYEGEVYDAGPRFTGINDLDESTTRRPSSIFNYMNNMTEAKMSQRAKNKAAIQVIPAQADLEDENKAEAVKSVLTAKAQEVDIDTLASAGDKSNFITGCSYTYIPWNESIGKGPISEQMGYACTGFFSVGEMVATFFDINHEHGMCELHHHKQEDNE